MTRLAILAGSMGLLPFWSVPPVTVHRDVRDSDPRSSRLIKFWSSIFSTHRTARDATALAETAERASLCAIPFSWQSLTIRRFATQPPTECVAPRCPHSHKAPAECSPTNRSMPWLAESGPGHPADDLRGANPPPYAAKTAGNAQHGAEVYQTFCSSCHGPNGTGGNKASSIVDPVLSGPGE